MIKCVATQERISAKLVINAAGVFGDAISRKGGSDFITSMAIPVTELPIKRSSVLTLRFFPHPLKDLSR